MQQRDMQVHLHRERPAAGRRSGACARRGRRHRQRPLPRCIAQLRLPRAGIADPIASAIIVAAVTVIAVTAAAAVIAAASAAGVPQQPSGLRHLALNALPQLFHRPRRLLL